MFQLGSLVVLCSLLTRTSAPNSEILQNLIIWDNLTRESELRDMSNEEIQFSSNSMNFNGFGSSLFLNKTKAEEHQDKALELEFQLRDVLILDLRDGLSSKEKGTEKKISITMNAYVLVPDDNSRDNTTIALEHECSLRVERESQNSQPYVTLWKCANETMKDISDSSGRENATMESIMDRLFNSLSERDSLLMEKQILEMSDAPLKLLAQAILNDLKMEENQSPSSEE